MFGLFGKKQNPQTALEKLIIAMYGDPPPQRGRASLNDAVRFANKDLLGEVVELSKVSAQAKILFDGAIPYTTEELALSTALGFFKEARLISELQHMQLFARMKALEWHKAGKLNTMLLQSFENDLYETYK